MIYLITFHYNIFINKDFFIETVLIILIYNLYKIYINKCHDSCVMIYRYLIELLINNMRIHIMVNHSTAPLN